MDELIKMVSQKIGVSEDQAKTAVSTVLGFIKDKLPAPIASQIEGMIGGTGTTAGAGTTAGDAGDGIGDVAKGIGGMFGG